MTAVLRARAATLSSNVQETANEKGGDGKSPLGLLVRPPRRRRFRYSHDPAAELMPAAEFLGQEPDFSAILEDFEDSPFDPKRRRVLGRLMGMFAMDYQGSRAQERAFLRRLLGADNPREGYVANRALHLCGASPVIRRTLALGVAEARFAAHPTRGFLGAVQARVAATTFKLLGPAGRERVWDLLTVAGTSPDGAVSATAERVLERALVLKAVAARRHRLGPWSPDGAAALEEVTGFAEALRGQPRRMLATATTLFPGDAEITAPRLAELGDAARAGYIARGDIDPVFALAEHVTVEVGDSQWDPDDEDAAVVAAEPGLGLDNLPELDRSPLLDRARVHQAFAEARKHDRGLSHDQINAVSDYLVGKELTERRTELKDAGLVVLEAQCFDVAPRATIEAIREDARGIYKFDSARALGDLLCRFTGAVYVRRVLSDQMTAGSDPLAQISRALSQGLAVPIVVRELKLPLLKAWAALAQRELHGEDVYDLRQPADGIDLAMQPKKLVAQVLPGDFGQKARVDSYMAPAALDLLAPPFGIAFPHLGIEDAL